MFDSGNKALIPYKVIANQTSQVLTLQLWIPSYRFNYPVYDNTSATASRAKRQKKKKKKEDV